MCGECNWPLKEENKDVRKPRRRGLQTTKHIQKNNFNSTDEKIQDNR